MAGSLYNKFQIDYRNEPVSTASYGLNDNYEAVLFGNAFTGTANGAERDHAVTHRDFPDAFRQARDNEYWGDVVTGLGLIDLGAFGTLILPLEYHKGINYEWRTLDYSASVLEQNPEETAARLLKSGESRDSARLISRGIAIQMEMGYWQTVEGMRHYARNMKAIVDSIHLTIVHDVVWSLFNANKSPQMWERQHGYVGLNMIERIEREIEWYGLVHLNANALQKWDSEAKKFAAAMGVTPDVYVCEPKGKTLIKEYHREQRWYMFVGPDGRASREIAEPNEVSIGRTPCYVTPAFSAYDTTERVPTLQKASIVGSYYKMVDEQAESGDQHKRTLRDRAIKFHDEDVDDDVEFSMTKALQNSHVFDDETGEVDELVADWKDDTDKSFMFTFKYGDSSGRQRNEKVRIWGQVEDWALDNLAIHNVAESALTPLSDQDRININNLFETFATIRAQPTALVSPSRTASGIKEWLAGLSAAQIKRNAALASWIGLEALAAKDAEVQKQVSSFKAMVRYLNVPFGGFTPITDRAQCPVFWRDIANDKAACTAWHLIVDAETAPTFFTTTALPAPTTNANAPANAHVVSSLSEIEDYLSKNVATTQYRGEPAYELIVEIVDRLRAVATTHLAEFEDRGLGALTVDDSKTIKAPIAFVRVLQAAGKDREKIHAILEKALGDPDDADAVLRDLNAQTAREFVEHAIQGLGGYAEVVNIPQPVQIAVPPAAAGNAQAVVNAKVSNLVYEWQQNFTYSPRVGEPAPAAGAGVGLIPSPYVCTASVLNLALYGGELALADPSAGFTTALADKPADAGSFINVYHKSTPSKSPYPYPGEGINEAAFQHVGDEVRRAPTRAASNFTTWLGMGDLGLAANPRQNVYQLTDREPVVHDASNSKTSMRHAHWFLSEAHWTNSPSLRDNWNRVLGTSDVARRVAMAAFLFAHVSMQSCMRLHEAKYVVPPYGFLLFRPNHTHMMGGYVLTESGPNTGVTAWTNPQFMMDDSATLMMMEGHYRIHIKSIVKRPQNVIRFDNAFFESYLGGGGHRPFTMADITAWHGNMFYPTRYERGAPSIQVVMVPYTERTFDTYVDLTGAFSSNLFGRNNEGRKVLHYTSAHFYRAKHMYGSMRQQKLGFLHYYPAPNPNRLCIAGRQINMDETGEFNPAKATQNRGHLKSEYPGIGRIRGGFSMLEPRGVGITVLGTQ